MKENAPGTSRPWRAVPLLRSFYHLRTPRAAALMAALGVTACGYNDSRSAHKGQLAVIGMSSEDLQACAGIPDKTARLDEHVQIFQYTRTINVPSTNDSTLFPLQTVVNLTQTSMGGAGKTCIASIRLVDDHVTDMHYSGDNDRMIGSDGVCATLVKGCLAMPPASAHSVSNNPLFGPVSAFHTPKPPTAKNKTATAPALHYVNATAPDISLAPLPAPMASPVADPTTAPPNTGASTAEATPEPQGAPANPLATPTPATTPPATNSAAGGPALSAIITGAETGTGTVGQPTPAPANSAPATTAPLAVPAESGTENSNQAAAIDPTNPDTTPQNTCATAQAQKNSSTKPATTPSEKAGAPCAAPLDHKS